MQTSTNDFKRDMHKYVLFDFMGALSILKKGKKNPADYAHMVIWFCSTVLALQTIVY